MGIADAYKVALFGHRDFDGHRVLDERLYPLLQALIRTKPFLEIYIGRNGEFDQYAATVVKRLQKAMGTANNALICVLPYSVKDMEYYEKYYDAVILPECIERMHPKAAITRRNQWMIEQADLVILYAEREEGGAYTARKYAEGLGKRNINLAIKDPDETE